jgi:hypothetical protein
MQQRLSAEVIKKLMKKYRKNPGTKVGDPKRIQQMLAKGTSIPRFMKKGGNVRKKTKTKK